MHNQAGHGNSAHNCGIIPRPKHRERQRAPCDQLDANACAVENQRRRYDRQACPEEPDAYRNEAVEASFVQIG